MELHSLMYMYVLNILFWKMLLAVWLDIIAHCFPVNNTRLLRVEKTFIKTLCSVYDKSTYTEALDHEVSDIHT